ncbi:hypothetical protein [Roseibacillus ishigakijimensis]|uniref:Uncharacterized protein n=1 Tax=Roseibacillus ishigakijimensis TaxID=454146 RepID=A0A934RUS7_9BACT|nr:hypothetical protein [Roseibacillus ishigakijimensis]MBK1834861.1 hypothetical protein [Roseibacillus ishigakijimensis]
METSAGPILRAFCEERLAVLEDETVAETRAFIQSFGAPYHQQVVTWFRQALTEQKEA